MTWDEVRTIAKHPNLLAFCRVLREGESNQQDSAFQLLYGGGHFDSFIDHPRIRFLLPNGSYTTAAGAYQITESTWNDFTKAYPPQDFTPESQTRCVVWLLDRAGALEDVIAGRLDAAIRKLPKVWTSLALPRIQGKAQAIFTKYGGTLSGGPLPGIPNPQTPQEVKRMGPFVVPFLEAIATIIPAVKQLGFGSGSEVAQRNVAAASIVADAVVKAVDAGSKEEALNKLRDDPDAVVAAKQAVQDVLYELAEAGSGGIDGARKFADPTQPFWRQGAFYVSLLLLAMPFLLLADVFFVHPQSYDGNLRTQIVTAVLVVVSMVGSFWLGTSASSQRKTEVMASK